MKFGLTWFLRLDTPIQIARIITIPCLIWVFFAPIRSIFFVLALSLFIASLLITICTCFMHIPSTEKVEKFISKYESEFLEKQKIEFRNHKNVEILELKCFADNRKIRLCRRIGKKKIFDTLVMLAWVETQDGLWLVYDEKALWRDSPANKKSHQIHAPKEIQITKIDANNDEIIWSLQVGGDFFRMSCKEDYHFRDFINKYNVTML